MAEQLRHTPLLPVHEAAKANLVNFHGWEMPMNYPAGILAERNAVRTKSGIGDVSHMGRLQIKGSDAVAYVSQLVTYNPRRLVEGQAHYAAMCYEDGGMVDDVVIYLGPNNTMRMVINASNREKDLDWMRSHTRGFNVQINDMSEELSLIALQGPQSQQKLFGLITDEETKRAISVLKPYHALEEVEVAGVKMFLPRTGYTGEDGFEFFVPSGSVVYIWNELRGLGVQECGLGARDSLRLEMKYPLYGNDIDETTNPLEAGLGWIVSFEEVDGCPTRDFTGRDALWAIKTVGVNRRLVGIKAEGRGPLPRQGHEIWHAGQRVGVATSAGIAPSLNARLGLAYLPNKPEDLTKIGTDVEFVDPDRNLRIPAKVVRTPFYRREDKTAT